MHWIHCYYILIYKIIEIKLQNDTYGYMIQKSMEKKNKGRIALVFLYQHLWMSKQVYDN